MGLGVRVKVTLKKSRFGRRPAQRRTAEALGLRRIGKSAVHEMNDSIRGMLRVVEHMVTVEEVSDDSSS